MSNSNTRSLVGLALVLALALLAVWMMWPSLDTGPTQAEAEPVPDPLAIAEPVAHTEVPDEPAGEAEVVIIEGDDPDIPTTTKCETIAGWAQAGTPHYTLLDNIRDQAMRFTEDDLACLTAARDVPPIVLRFAEMYQKRDQ